MVHLLNFLAPLVATFLIGFTVAHPPETYIGNEKIERDLQRLDILAGHAKRSLEACSRTLKARELNERAVIRRAAIAEGLRKKRGIAEKPLIHRRSLAGPKHFELINHQQNKTGYSLNTDAATLFGANTSYILTPEQTVGPYYVLGEHIRSNVTENEKGVPMHLEMQFVDVETCKAVPNLLVDIWACNSTGVYSGIEGEGTLQSTFLRGVQKSDDEGVVQFDTIFPGHYQGRTTHEHVVVTANATLLPNGTFQGGTVNHIGQLYFDESLRAAVESTAPYNTNQIPVLSYNNDGFAKGAATENYDPFPEYIMLGDSLADGLMVWINIGIKTTANFTDSASVAAYWGADGGRVNSNARGGPRPPGPPPPGAPPGLPLP